MFIAVFMLKVSNFPLEVNCLCFHVYANVSSNVLFVTGIKITEIESKQKYFVSKFNFKIEV